MHAVTEARGSLGQARSFIALVSSLCKQLHCIGQQSVQAQLADVLPYSTGTAWLTR